MRGTRPTPKAEIDAVQRLADQGLTASQIGTALHRNDETIRRIARSAGIAIAMPEKGTKTELTQEEADAIRERLRRVHAAGPVMGVCVVCGFWRRLDADGRLPLHDQGDGKCRGSRYLPLPSYTD